MSLRWCESFRNQSLATFSQRCTTYSLYSTGVEVSQTNGRFDACLDWGTGVLQFFELNFAAQDTWIVGFAFRLAAGSTGAGDLVSLKNSTDALTHATLRITAMNQLVVTRNGTTLSASSAQLQVGQWYYIEFKATIADAGSYEVRINGITAISGSADTRNGGTSATADVIRFSNTASLSNGRITDIYICDGAGTANNTFLGDVRVVSLLPNASGTYSQWTPSAGSNYQCVDDATPNGDTDYVSSATPGQIDTYNFQDLSLLGTIFGVLVTAHAAKDDAGTRQVAIHYKSGASEGDGATVSLPTSYTGQVNAVLESDPATSSAWSLSGLNAAEFGVKCIA
jgi:hypothetical protein